jgi:uncharacterized protein YyaL (SSP411 family)
MRTNHLIDEKSPYLLQHAHNPVDWYPWGEAAFDRAKLEDKPILLSVGYSTCHWCHVMAHESFEDRDISQIINDHFIAIKVDREERPDIDHIYMTATTSMTGQGGWPLTVFLTPQGDPFYGGTYFPPYAKWGSVGFIDLLNSIASGWKSDRANILSSSLSITEGLRRRSQVSTSSEIIDKTFLDHAFRQMRGQFDGDNGGFGSSPKFPMGHNLSFLLRYYKQGQTSEALDMVKKTLTAMSHGGIWDHLGGGFHRYSTDQYWHVPHFEKMLYDQALLSRAYLEAYQATGMMEYEQIARAILDYVLSGMTDGLGGFYSAEDADSLESPSGHLKEGAFYVFAQSEIEENLDKDSAAVFNYCYGVLPQGNASFDPHGEFTGKNILYQVHSVEEAAGEFHRQTDEIQGIIEVSKTKLLALRSERPRPHLDDKVLCDWNGLMIASFAFASRVLGEPAYAKVSTRAADFMLTHMMAGKRLLHRWRDGEAGIMATLDDYAFFIYGLLEVYEATFQDKYLDAAEDLADEMIRLFADQAGGFFMTAIDAESLIIRPKEAYDGAIPSGNSVAALILLKLYALTQKDIYNAQAESLFSSFTSTIAQSPHAHTFLLSALDWHLQGPLEISFHGAGDDSTVAKMLKVLYKHFIPAKSVKLIPSLDCGQAHICYRGTCKAPTENVGVFEQELIVRF